MGGGFICSAYAAPVDDGPIPLASLQGADVKVALPSLPCSTKNRLSVDYNRIVTSSATTAIEVRRREANSRLDPDQRVELGQFMTPAPIAKFMASLFRNWGAVNSVLDPGAGIGSLTEAFFDRFLECAPKGASLNATAFEIDPTLLAYLSEHFVALPERGRAYGYRVDGQVKDRDFVIDGALSVRASASGTFTHAILNPPYRKIGSNSEHRRALKEVGVESVNLYTGFLALAVALTTKGGEVVAIVPRSFCNGTYFKQFREWLLSHVSIRQIHVFDSRSKAFQEDSVLQENIILHLEKLAPQGSVIISRSNDGAFSDYTARTVAFNEVVFPNDPGRFIRIPINPKSTDDKRFSSTLNEINVQVATGPVVDFRVKAYWLDEPTDNSVPLLYAHHFLKNAFVWPRQNRKPNALRVHTDTEKWLLPRGYYCVTKRFTSKEERRRIVAYVVDPEKLPGERIGIENHLNVFHAAKRGLPKEIAFGLAAYLNSTEVDVHFRTFSGHTQVNATDLRSMNYPTLRGLARLGAWAQVNPDATQEDIDRAVHEHGN